MFMMHFKGAKLVKKPATYLMSMRQGKNESLEAYTRRFNNEAMLVEDFTDLAAIQTILNGLRSGAFKWNISKNTLRTLSGVIEKAQKHVIAKGLVFTDEVRPQLRPQVKDTKGKDKKEQTSNPKSTKGSEQPPPRVRQSALDAYTHLTMNRREILN